MSSPLVVTTEGLTVFKSTLSADQETDLIKVSAKTQEAQLPHSFSAAQWTHPNGHPRCRVCGCEETVSGTCPGLKAEPVRFGPGAVKVATSEGIVVAKFNPYHDKGGRFASGGTPVSGSGTIKIDAKALAAIEDRSSKLENELAYRTQRADTAREKLEQSPADEHRRRTVEITESKRQDAEDKWLRLQYIQEEIRTGRISGYDDEQVMEALRGIPGIKK